MYKSVGLDPKLRDDDRKQLARRFVRADVAGYEQPLVPAIARILENDSNVILWKVGIGHEDDALALSQCLVKKRSMEGMAGRMPDARCGVQRDEILRDIIDAIAGNSTPKRA